MPPQPPSGRPRNPNTNQRPVQRTYLRGEARQAKKADIVRAYKENPSQTPAQIAQRTRIRPGQASHLLQQARQEGSIKRRRKQYLTDAEARKVRSAIIEIRQHGHPGLTTSEITAQVKQMVSPETAEKITRSTVRNHIHRLIKNKRISKRAGY